MTLKPNDKELNLEFLELVKAGLWDYLPDNKLFSESTDWKRIYDLSQTQSLSGIVLDGINKLPKELLPPRALYIKWCAEILHIEDENLRLDKEVANLFSLLRSYEIEPVLMKGQAIAKLYPEPTHRASGDIDIYIGKENYDKVNKILSNEGEALEKWSPKHIMYKWHEVIIENHRLIGKMISPRLNRKLHSLVDEWHLTGNTDSMVIAGTRITILPLDFNIVFLLLHSVIHLMGFGIGLRQICDWAIILNRYKDQINRPYVKILLKKLGLTKASKIFGALSVNYLGLPKEDLIIPYSNKDEHQAELLLEDILHNGNFGFSGERGKNRRGNWIKKINNFLRTSKRSWQLRLIAPEEAFWKPYHKFSTFVDIRIYRFKNLSKKH